MLSEEERHLKNLNQLKRQHKQLIQVQVEEREDKEVEEEEEKYYSDIDFVVTEEEETQGGEEDKDVEEETQGEDENEEEEQPSVDDNIVEEEEEGEEEEREDKNLNLEKKKPFACKIGDCSASFSKKSKLLFHIRRHCGERPFVCSHPNCTKAYTNSSHLLRHKRCSHPSKEEEKEQGKQKNKIKCPIEGCQLYLNKANLKRHKDRMHNPNRKLPFKCEICQEEFARKQQLKIHVIEHTGINPFLCEICGSRFTRIRDKNRHKRTHTTYECKCSMKFERWTALRKHQAKCKTMLHKCDVCGKSFTRKGSLRRHVENSHSEGALNVYECSYEDCERKYFYLKNLQYHIRVFHEKVERPTISCPYENCERTFYQRQKLQIHVKGIHEKSQTKKKDRKPRKDKGKSKKNILSTVTGIQIAKKTNKAILTTTRTSKNKDKDKENEKRIEVLAINCNDTQKQQEDIENSIINKFVVVEYKK